VRATFSYRLLKIIAWKAIPEYFVCDGIEQVFNADYNFAYSGVDRCNLGPLAIRRELAWRWPTEREPPLTSRKGQILWRYF
jgi:hypothetical protein